jgi:hypothetical protein
MYYRKRRSTGPLKDEPIFKFMTARFRSKCVMCGTAISKGDYILYRSISKIGKACAACEPCGKDWKSEIDTIES